MKKLLATLLCTILITACETVKKPTAYSRPPESSRLKPIQPKPPPISFSGKTNADLIMESVLNLSLPKFQLPKNSTISVGSLEAFNDDEFQEHPLKYNHVNALVEDVLVMNFPRENGHVVEKNLHTLSRLYRKAQGDYHPNPLIPHGSAGLDDFQFLESVDYILSFRVFECGVRYEYPLETLHQVSPRVDRIAVTKINLRLVNAKTGIIAWSGMLTGSASDQIPARFLGLAEDSHYQFYHFTYPARSGSAFRDSNTFLPTADRSQPKEKSLFKKIIDPLLKKDPKPSAKDPK